MLNGLSTPFSLTSFSMDYQQIQGSLNLHNSRLRFAIGHPLKTLLNGSQSTRRSLVPRGMVRMLGGGHRGANALDVIGCTLRSIWDCVDDPG